MHNQKVFTGCMIRHGGLLAAEAILALAVSVILVQGNKIISGFLAECGSQPVCAGSLYGV